MPALNDSKFIGKQNINGKLITPSGTSQLDLFRMYIYRIGTRYAAHKLNVPKQKGGRMEDLEAPRRDTQIPNTKVGA